MFFVWRDWQDLKNGLTRLLWGVFQDSGDAGRSSCVWLKKWVGRVSVGTRYRIVHHGKNVDILFFLTLGTVPDEYAICMTFRHGCEPVLRIRIHMFLGLPDLDPLVRGLDPDPDPSIIMQK
jgi:hypothetical protein